MYHVLVVDDEPFARYGLTQHFNWQRLGCEVVAEAEDGIQAISKIQSMDIDIVITDVKMPNMDGIALANEIMQHHPQIKVIMISGYGDLDYLKAAFKAATVDYILKPIDISELEATVQRVVTLLDEAKDKEKVYNQIDLKLLKSMPFLKKNFLMTLINDDIRVNNALQDKLIDLGIDLPLKGRMNVMIIRLDNQNDILSESDYQRISFSILNLFQELLEQSYKGCCFENCRGEYICIASLGDKEEQELFRIAENGREILWKHIELSTTICVGSTVNAIEELKSSYSVAKNILEQKHFFGKNRVIVADQINVENDGDDWQDNYKLYHDLTESVRQGNYVHAKELMEEYFSGLHLKKNVSLKYLQSIGLYLLQIPNHVLKEQAADKIQLHYDEKYEFANLCQLETVEEIQNYILKVYQQVCEKIAEFANDGHLIRRLKNIIENRYSQNLTIKDLAAEVYLSPTYLSYLFKKRTGYTINDYITYVRIEKAKELLKDPKNNLTDITYAVGYQESGYFSRIFKKQTGVLPSKYRESL